MKKENESRSRDVLRIFAQIDIVVADPEQYEVGEQPPAQETVDRIKSIIGDCAYMKPAATASVFFGGLEVDWCNGRNWEDGNRRYIKLAYHPGGEVLKGAPFIYWSIVDKDATATSSGSIIPAGPKELAERL